MFDILNISQQELRHSDFLAFLFNPRKSGYIGEQFLKYFLSMLVAEKGVNIANLNFFQIFYAKIENVNVYRELAITEGGSIDILIDLEVAGKKIVIAIENKINSGENGNQLEKYQNYLHSTRYEGHEKILLYLTPDEEEPSSNKWTPIRYTFIYETLNRVDTELVDLTVKILLEDYKNLLRREFKVAEEDSLAKQALEIYKNNRNIFDFIYNKKPDWIKITSTIFYELLEQKDAKMIQIVKNNLEQDAKNKGTKVLKFKIKNLENTPYYFWLNIEKLCIYLVDETTQNATNLKGQLLLKDKGSTDKMIENFQNWVLDDIDEIKRQCQEVVDAIFKTNGIIDLYIAELKKQITTENKTL